MSFINDDFILTNETAKRLYHDYAKKMPIIDYHCHINPKEIYEHNSKVRVVIDRLRKGFAGEKFDDIANYLIEGGRPDPYMCLIDFDSYLNKHEQMDKVYRNPMEWNKMSLMNIARSGFFAADRSISDYANYIWKLENIK